MVGKRLGGKASHDELYRLFAWPFLLMGSAVLLSSLLLLTLEKPSTLIELVAAIPSLVIFCCASRCYWVNIIVSQQFTRIRGVVCIVISLALFLVLIAGGGAVLSIICELGMKNGVLSLFAQC
jgi:hypothetical protein